MSEYRFYGWEGADVAPVDDRILTVGENYESEVF